MHTEHLNNIRGGQLFIGWFIAVAAASLLIFVFIAMGLLDAEGNTGGNWIAVAMAIGFAVGGAYVGLMVGLAPILHGVLLGLLSIVVWALVNALVSLLSPSFQWTTLTGPLTLNVILIQIISAVVGARFGYRRAVSDV